MDSVKRRTFLKGIGAAGLTASVAGCLGVGDNPALSVIGVETGSTTPPWRVIEDQNLPDDYDTEFEIDFLDVASGQNQFRLGEYELGNLGFESVVRVNNQEDDDIRIVTPLNRMHHGAVAHQDTGISNFQEMIDNGDDLVGGSLPQGSASYNFLDAIFSFNDEDIEEFDIRTGPPPAVYGFAQEGEIDVLFSFPPFLTNLMAGDFELIFTYYDWGLEMWDLPTVNVPITTRQSVIDEKPQAISDFVEMWWQAGQYVVDNKAEVIETYAEQIGTQTAQQRSLFDEYTEGIYVTGHDEELRQGSIRQLEAQYELGNLEVEPDIDTIFVDPRDL